MSSFCGIDDENYIKLVRVVYILKNNKLKLQQKHEDQIFDILDIDYDINYAVPSRKQDQYFEPSSMGNTLLHFVVDTSDKSYCVQNAIGESIVSQLLSLGADFTRRNHKGLTPLHLADIDNSDKSSFIVKKLLQAHLKYNNATNPRNNYGLSHFHLACKYGDIDVITFFLNTGVSVNESVNMNSKSFPGYSPLHFAMTFGDIDIILLLIKYGADCNYLNAEGMSPVHLIIKEQIEHGLLNYELQRRCENILDAVMIRNGYFSWFKDNIGLSNFHIYCMKKFNLRSEDMKKFLNAGVDIFNAPVNFDSPVWPGYTPLHFSAQFNLSRTIALLKEGANLLAKDAKGTTPFDLCLQKYKPDEVILILKTQKTLRSIMFENGTYLIHVLVSIDVKEQVEKYLVNGNVNAAIPFDSPLWPGYTVLHLAVILSRFDDMTNFELCLKYGANLMKQDANGMTALHLAFQERRWKTIEYLFSHRNEDFHDCKDHKDLSVFHIACISCRLDVVEDFLRGGVDVNMRIKMELENLMTQDETHCRIRAGSTPLHVAVAIKSRELADILLRNNADPMLLDEDGFSWIHRVFINDLFDLFHHLLWLSPKSFEANAVTSGGLSHFHAACASSDLSAAKALLPLVTNINEPIKCDVKNFFGCYSFQFGDTPLHLAIKSSYCSEKLIDFLLRNGADIKVKNVEGQSPIHSAIFEFTILEQGFIQRLDLEVQNQQHDQDDEESKRQCFSCISNNIYPIVKLMKTREIWLALYRNIKVINISYHTYNYIEDYVKKQLLVKSLKGDNKLFINEQGLSSFHISCIENDYDAVKEYIQSGVDVNTPKYYFADTDGGYTALHYAVDENNPSIIELLLKHGADVNLQNSKGNTAVHLAASKNPHLIELFFSVATEINHKIKNAFDKKFLDVLLVSRSVGSNTFLNLLKSKWFLELTDLSDIVFLVKKLFSTFSGDVFKSLIECIPDLKDLNDDDGNNIIHCICTSRMYQNFERSVQNFNALLNNGCKLDCQNNQGLTPLHCATIAGTESKVKALLFLGADINVRNIDGNPYCWTTNPLVHKLLREYIHRLKAANLQTYDAIIIDNRLIRKFSLELSEIKKINITKSITLRSVLTTEMAMRFPILPKDDRQAIIDYIDSDELQQKFFNWMPLFNLQKRKALKRLLFFEPSFIAIRDILDPRLPDHCLEFILACLSDVDWQNCIKSVTNLIKKS